MDNLNTDILRSLPILIPLSKNNSIGGYIIKKRDEISSFILLIQSQIRKLQEYQTALISATCDR